MFEFLTKLFSLKPKAVPAEAPYKVEAPVAPVAVVETPSPVVENTVPEVAKTEAIISGVPSAVKKPRKPRAPKVEAEASAITAKPKKAKAASDKPKAPRKPKITIAK